MNFPQEIVESNSRSLGEIGFFVMTLLAIGLMLSMIFTVFQILEKKISIIIKTLITIPSLVAVLSHSIRLLSLDNLRVLEKTEIINEYSTDAIFYLTLASLIYMVVKSLRRKDKKLTLSFALLYLSRYPLVISVIFMDKWLKLIMLLIFISFFNLIPYLWLRFFAGSMITGKLPGKIDRENLSAIFRKYKISKREEEIIFLILQGKNNREICDELYISVHTVKNHIYSIFQKLDIKNRYQLINLLSEKTGVS